MGEVIERDKAQRLIRFLREYVHLGLKITRDVAAYQRSGRVAWFHEVPRLDGCKGALWGDDLGEKSWLQVQKPDLDAPPTPKLGLKPWVKTSSPTSEPALRETIRVPDPVARMAGEVRAEITQRIEDYPDKREEFERYLEEWRVWQHRNRNKIRVLELYNRLFLLYRDERQYVETMEVVVGLGLASWRPMGAAPCRRHVIAARAELSFDRVRGILTVRCPDPPQGASPQVEDEFLPVQIDEQARIQIQQDLTDLGDDIFNLDSLANILKPIANEADPQSSVTEELEPMDAGGPHLRIDLAPAIILRRRGVGGLLRVYDDIADQLSTIPEVPFGVRALLDPIDEPTEPLHSEDAAAHSGDTELFFPLLANETQEKVAATLMRRHGVLVQGPPGTGKSHTIANLMSHLLAHGNRVLVTSETARALGVLKDMLPKEVQPLCVNLLGASSQALAELTESVNRMTERHASFDPSAYKQEIERKAAALRSHRQRRAEVEKQLMELREAETLQHHVNNKYEGTPTAIARAVKNAVALHEWLQVEEVSSQPLRNIEALELLDGLRTLPPESQEELLLEFPKAETLPDPEALRELFAKERKADEHLQEFADTVDDPWTDTFVQLEDVTASELSDGFSLIARAVEDIGARSDAWRQDAVADAFADDVRRWEVLFASTAGFLKEGRAREFAETVDATPLALPSDVPAQQIIEDAQAMRRHLAEGKSWKRFGIPSRDARNRVYLRDIRVGAARAETADVLAQLGAILRFKQRLQSVWDVWEGLAAPRAGSASLQIADLESNRNVVKTVLALHQGLSNAWSMLRDISTSLPLPRTATDVDRLGRVLAAASAQRARSQSEKPLAELGRILGLSIGPNSHPVNGRLLQALEERDLAGWRSACDKLRELVALDARRSRTGTLLDALEQGAPAVAASMRSNPNDPKWDDRLGRIEDAFAWAQAKQWLHDVVDDELLLKLERDYEELTKQIGQITAELGAAKAWLSFLSRLTPQQSASLQAWGLAIRKIGKGTGKSAPHYRAEAQRHMTTCAPAIPAWIIPRYRIPELMNIEQGMFDVAIIDEASQTGIDGLFLHYIAKKTVVVGDDQQISPAGVGVSQDAVFRLQQEYLDGIFIGKQLDAGTSLYDVAKVLFASQSKLVLQEHFRCMPEIIRYSDSLSYARFGTPLIPLRNFSPARLTPLMDVYVEAGYQESSGSTMRNLPEAEALAEAVVSCVESSQYDGKSMGVISLTGSRQAETISQMLLERLGPDVIEERQLVCGDAYSFQGNERDVMFLSLVAAPTNGVHVQALVHNRYRQRFNVAASRARDQMWLFHSAKLDHLSSNPDCVRRSLVEFFTRRNDYQLGVASELDVNRLRALATQPGDRGVPPSPFDSWFEIDVYLDLVSHGYVARPQYPVANYRIDLVVDGMKTRLAIECDGDVWHGAENHANDVRRQRQLERAGWQFFRIRGSEYYVDPERALVPLWSLLHALEIQPGMSSGSDEGTHGDAPQVLPWEGAPSPGESPPGSQASEVSSIESDQKNAPPPPERGITPTRLQDLFRWSRENLLLSVMDRVSLAEIATKVGDGADLSDDERTDLFRIYDLAWQRGFRPGAPN